MGHLYKKRRIPLFLPPFLGMASIPKKRRMRGPYHPQKRRMGHFIPNPAFFGVFLFFYSNFQNCIPEFGFAQGHFMRGHWLNASMPKCCWEKSIFDPQFFSFTTFSGVLLQFRQNSDKNSDNNSDKTQIKFRQQNSDNKIQTKFRQKNSDKIQTQIQTKIQTKFRQQNSDNKFQTKIQTKFRQNSDQNSDKFQTKLQTKFRQTFRQNSDKIQTKIQAKFRQNSDKNPDKIQTT